MEKEKRGIISPRGGFSRQKRVVCWKKGCMMRVRLLWPMSLCVLCWCDEDTTCTREITWLPLLGPSIVSLSPHYANGLLVAHTSYVLYVLRQLRVLTTFLWGIPTPFIDGLLSCLCPCRLYPVNNFMFFSAFCAFAQYFPIANQIPMFCSKIIFFIFFLFPLQHFICYLSHNAHFLS